MTCLPAIGAAAAGALAVLLFCFCIAALLTRNIEAALTKVLPGYRCDAPPSERDKAQNAPFQIKGDDL